MVKAAAIIYPYAVSQLISIFNNLALSEQRGRPLEVGLLRGDLRLHPGDLRLERGDIVGELLDRQRVEIERRRGLLARFEILDIHRQSLRERLVSRPRS